MSQNALTFSLKHQGVFKKPLDVFIWSSDKTRVGLARRPTRFMPEDERSSYYICSILFHVQNFRNFKLLDIERVSYEVPLWTPFLFVIVILHAFGRPDDALWYLRLSKNGTSTGNFMLINLIYNKFEVPEEDFRVLFSLLYIIIRCSISFLCKAFDFYALRHVLKISDLREKSQKVYKKEQKVFGRYVLKQ